MTTTYRGSRKHVLDWVESPGFLAELREIVEPVDVEFPTPVTFRPTGYRDAGEVELDRAHATFPVLRPVHSELCDWWLRHRRGARTPTWDLVVGCEIERTPGLVLVEAKANSAELKAEGVAPAVASSKNSLENRDQIRAAIASARLGLSNRGFKTDLSADRHYQLANRVAFMWKLASLGVPVVLIYLGFTGDMGIADVGAPFEDEAAWQKAFRKHAEGVIPLGMLEDRLDLGAAPAWLLVRSRGVIGQSVPRRPRA